jgi:Protein of unknown function (DUF3489)
MAAKCRHFGGNSLHRSLTSSKDTKQAQVLACCAVVKGASGPKIAEATGWARHTLRGFLAGLAKKRLQVEVLERVRQVGPNKRGAKGSYTVYHLAGEAELDRWSKVYACMGWNCGKSASHTHEARHHYLANPLRLSRPATAS